MRRRLALLSLATTALVVISLLIPLGLLVRRQAGDRARLEAERTAQSTAALLALTVSLNEDAGAIESALGPLDPGTIVVLPDGSVLGEPTTDQGSLVADRRRATGHDFRSCRRWLGICPSRHRTGRHGSCRCLRHRRGAQRRCGRGLAPLGAAWRVARCHRGLGGRSAGRAPGPADQRPGLDREAAWCGGSGCPGAGKRARGDTRGRRVVQLAGREARRAHCRRARGRCRLCPIAYGRR